ncbi:MAG: hypothetical protein DRR08_33230 [Candidatus Parabeggiatoa sp. nov. 2]|nr:MAG: hypothetical protein DRR08_33230 [Gammaproteobacteria bacterium]
MSGSEVPYQIRPNKTVDRQIFIDLLSRINTFRDIRQYTYVGFGGPTLEDFKLMHSHFGNERMISLEEDETTYHRQKFNNPLSCIKLLNISSYHFIVGYADYLKGKPAIVWLDYASPRNIKEQLQEFQKLLSKTECYDIVKLTLNANPQYWEDVGLREFKESQQTLTPEDRQVLRFLMFEKNLQPFIPDWVESTHMGKNYPSVLVGVLYKAAVSDNDQNGFVFTPLTAFYYQDSLHQMLTLTGIVLDEANEESFYQQTSIKEWDLAMQDWYSKPKKIALPSLSVKEKIYIDKYLPNNIRALLKNKTLHRLLGKNAEEILRNYIQYYRYYPNFHKVFF